MLHFYSLFYSSRRRPMGIFLVLTHFGFPTSCKWWILLCSFLVIEQSFSDCNRRSVSSRSTCSFIDFLIHWNIFKGHIFILSFIAIEYKAYLFIFNSVTFVLFCFLYVVCLASDHSRCRRNKKEIETSLKKCPCIHF